MSDDDQANIEAKQREAAIIAAKKAAGGASQEGTAPANAPKVDKG